MMQTPQAANQVVKRSITNSDLELISKYYNNHQKGLKVLAMISFVFFFIFIIFNYVLYDITFDWSIYLVFYLVSFIIGLVTLILSLKFILNRKKISDALTEGTILEVKAPAYRNRAVPNASSWTVGPISVFSRTALNMIQEGVQTTVVCLPKMNAALAINNMELIYDVKIICPPNLESMAMFDQKPKFGSEKEKLENEIDNELDSDKRLTKLKELKEKGLITQEDYESKKKEILIKM